MSNLRWQIVSFSAKFNTSSFSQVVQYPQVRLYINKRPTFPSFPAEGPFDKIQTKKTSSHVQRKKNQQQARQYTLTRLLCVG